ncbi:succinylglutamate desuccinylase/aspartoacylase family protein [Chromobacterium sp. IIBBL 290-4]|uniref:succinylglutamate desuccinylase/aspartoacylase family protein n=1 Tax=Chromobacterium sp. IIBBL 290-4 TaxID=2953890 RepID=UPI0020B72868|nr:succinylglutamate desuccinylase/aspartoacylase family protein [Chromobacterium sp. IIBBL 290-4]UTH75254.1 M14 family metallopeptidase [Chromobacterium sp. IIBBL 290-4]
MHVRHHPLLSPSLGTQRALTSFHFGQSGQGEKVHIQASLHADELPGMLVAWHLKQRLRLLEDEGAIRGEITVLPVANPIGLNQNQNGRLLGRFELLSGQNFNRHYLPMAEPVFAAVRGQLGPDASANTRLIREAMRNVLLQHRPQTELQSLRHTLHSLAFDADIMLDLHCDSRADLHLYTGTPLWDQCEPLSRYLGACASLLAEDSGDQPFDEACSQPWWQLRDLAAQSGLSVPIEMACLAVTVELRGEWDVNHEYAARDAEGIIHFLQHRGVIAGDAPELPPLRHPATPLAGSEDLLAPHAGVVVYRAEPGSLLSPGDLVADVIDPEHDVVSQVCTQRGGVLYATSDRPYATAGLGIARVAGDTAFKSGKLLTA